MDTKGVFFQFGNIMNVLVSSFQQPPKPHLAKLHNLNFHPLEVVSRYRDPQLG